MTSTSGFPFALLKPMTCNECGGAGNTTPDHPNDPDARIYPCEYCEGKGTVPYPADGEKADFANQLEIIEQALREMDCNVTLFYYPSGPGTMRSGADEPSFTFSVHDCSNSSRDHDMSYNQTSLPEALDAQQEVIAKHAAQKQKLLLERRNQEAVDAIDRELAAERERRIAALPPT